MTKNTFNFKREFGWSDIIAVTALILAAISIYQQYKSNSTEVLIQNDKLLSANFVDKDGQKKYFGYQRATIINSGNKSVTLLGLKPNENTGLILTQEYGAKNLEKDKLKCEIFQIPDSILSDRLFSKEKNLWDFKDQGLEKLSVMNKVIQPGEVYTLNIGTVYDLYSDKSKHYKTIIFSSELIFSNGQKLLFGVADDNILE